jgi:hypothetical protein
MIGGPAKIRTWDQPMYTDNYREPEMEILVSFTWGRILSRYRGFVLGFVLCAFAASTAYAAEDMATAVEGSGF